MNYSKRPGRGRFDASIHPEIFYAQQVASSGKSIAYSEWRETTNNSGHPASCAVAVNWQIRLAL